LRQKRVGDPIPAVWRKGSLGRILGRVAIPNQGRKMEGEGNQKGGLMILLR